MCRPLVLTYGHLEVTMTNPYNWYCPTRWWYHDQTWERIAYPDETAEIIKSFCVVSDATGCYPQCRHAETTRHGQRVLFHRQVFIPEGLGQTMACLGTEKTNSLKQRRTFRFYAIYRNWL